MNDPTLVYAIIVFVLLAIGLVLTVLEFRYGQPKREQRKWEAEGGALPNEEHERAA